MATKAAAADLREPAGSARRSGRTLTVRAWSVRRARFHEGLYAVFSGVLLRLHGVWRRIGYHRVETPLVPVERTVKRVLFDCRMCGECLLTSTGMACPMACPKELRNGPCGGVRSDGMCEVDPALRCVWVDAWEGSRRMRHGDRILEVQPPLDHRLRGTSAWLRATLRSATAPRPDGGGMR